MMRIGKLNELIEDELFEEYKRHNWVVREE